MNILEQEIWKTNYVQPLFDKYKSIPNTIKYALIEKDFIRMYGKRLTKDMMRYMYEDTDNFIFAFDNANAELSDRIKVNILRKEFSWLAFKEYVELLQSGLFFEFFPQLSGEYKKDQKEFESFVRKREFSKDYIKLLIF